MQFESHNSQLSVVQKQPTVNFSHKEASQARNCAIFRLFDPISTCLYSIILFAGIPSYEENLGAFTFYPEKLVIVIATRRLIHKQNCGILAVIVHISAWFGSSLSEEEALKAFKMYIDYHILPRCGMPSLRIFFSPISVTRRLIHFTKT